MLLVIHIKVTAKYIHGIIKNSSMGVSNVIGPLEKMTLSNQRVKGLYYMPINGPQVSIITFFY